MAFLGEIVIKLDDKGRMRIPTALKEAMSDKAAHRFVVNRGFENCLTLYPYDVWEVVKAKVDKLNTFNREKREFVRKFYSGATICALDGSDRINIPNQLLDFAGMKKDIILTPVKDYYELWDQKKYNDMISQADSSSFEELAERVMGDSEDTLDQ
ncbi:MAG: division/cell wall cluster transcriptional repressor MraZ [Chitinophagales bacterium]|jgi:MraZ protein|nr:division/cell wall cluster transcriptional repressor MraZ [Sphingobacteriales bacterium]